MLHFNSQIFRKLYPSLNPPLYPEKNLQEKNALKFQFLKNRLIEVLAHARGAISYHQAVAAAKDPQRTQQETLLKILKTHQNTDFGRQFGFSAIKSVEDFRTKLPVFEYEDLRPYIEKQELTKRPVLNAENPVLYAVTSGTTGKPKYIPVLKSTLNNFKKIQGFFTASLLQEHTEALRGRIAAIVSPSVEGHYPGSDTPIGSSSGRIYKDMPAMIRSKYLFPIEVFEIENYDLKYKTMMRLLLNGSDVSYIATANPSTLLKLISIVNQCPDVFFKDLAAGTFSEIGQLPEFIQKAIRPHIKADAMKARALENIFIRNGQLTFKDILPNLQVVTTWTGGSCKIFIHQLEGQFSKKTVFRELGYLSSEFRGNIPLTKNADTGLPALSCYFYEFVRKEDWENENPHFLGLHELKDKELYYVLITTESGLYRYNMNDVIQVDGHFQNTPLIRFIQKGKGVTSMTGEKLYENQLIEGVQTIESNANLISSFFLCTADENSCRYKLYYQPTEDSRSRAHEMQKELEVQLDYTLRKINNEYDCKRSSGRLKPPVIHILREGSYERFKRHGLHLGQREGQFKFVALIFERDLKFDFSECIEVLQQKSIRSTRDNSAAALYTY